MTTTEHNPQHNVRNLAKRLFQDNPVHMITCTVLLLIAGLTEVIGVVMLLPVVSITISEDTTSLDPVSEVLVQALEAVGLTLNLHMALVFITTMIILKAIFIFTANVVNIRVASAYTEKKRLQLVSVLIAAKWSYIVQKGTGTLSNALTLQAGGLVSVYACVLLFFALVLQSAVYLVVAFLSSPSVFVFAIGVGGIMFIIMKSVLKYARQLGINFMQLNQDLSDQMINSFNILKPLKAMGQETRVVPFLQNYIFGLRDTTRKTQLLHDATNLIQEPITIIFLSIGIFAITTFSEISPAYLIFVAILYYRIVTRLGQLQGYFQKLVGQQSFFWFVESLIEEADAEREMASNSGDELEDETIILQQGINLKDVSFAYDDNAVLDKLNLELPARSLISLMGPSGAGKTTIIDLVLGFYEPHQGQVLIDGQDLGGLDVMAWRRSIGLVPQDIVLANDTIYNNITLFDSSISREKVEKTLEMVEAWDFVSDKTEGLDTIVGEKGGKVSGGQRQRIAIARALVRNPSLLILDEPTSALDEKTAEKIYVLLKKLSKEITVLVISHHKDVRKVSDFSYDLSALKARSHEDVT